MSWFRISGPGQERLFPPCLGSKGGLLPYLVACFGNVGEGATDRCNSHGEMQPLALALPLPLAQAVSINTSTNNTMNRKGNTFISLLAMLFYLEREG